MAVDLEDDRVILALKQTLQHISLQQAKFKDTETELQHTKQQLENENNKYSNQSLQLQNQIKQLHDELHHFKSLSQTQASKISELQIKSAEQMQQNTTLTHQLNKTHILIEEMKVKTETNSISLVNELEKDNKMLQKQISTLKSKIDAQQINGTQFQRVKNENVTLQQTISNMRMNELSQLEKANKILQQEIQNRQKSEKQHCADIEATQIQLKELKNQNKILKLQNIQLEQTEKDMRVKYQNYCARMMQMGKCSFDMLENCRYLRRSITDTTSSVSQHKRIIKSEFKESLQKIGKMNLQNVKKSRESKQQMNQAIQKNLRSVKQTKLSLNVLRKSIEKELMDFNREIKAVQRGIFKQKSMIRKHFKDEKDKTAKLEQSLENEQNMKHRLSEYLKMKDELENKISNLEGCLKNKKEKDIIAEMKRFRTAAIVTSITSLSDDENKSISYHTLSKYERKALSLKSTFQKQINSEININEKVDEFIRSGGLKRYPIMEQEFKYQPNDMNNNRFRFGTKYISVSYNAKKDQLYVKNEHNHVDVELLQNWIRKNASIEMRKLLSKVSQKKKANKQISQPKKHVFL